MRQLAFTLAALAAAVPASAEDARPSAAGPYDGRWNATLVCEDLKENGALVKGYEFRFAAEIAGGELKAQYGSPGSPSSVTLVGIVSQTGVLEIRAEGWTSKSEYTVGRVPQGTHYRYTMAGRLADGQGTAQRRELRPCTLSLAKTG